MVSKKIIRGNRLGFTLNISDVAIVRTQANTNKNYALYIIPNITTQLSEVEMLFPL